MAPPSSSSSSSSSSLLLLLLCVSSLLWMGGCDVNCGGTDGQPGENGENGAAGRDGWPGVKGEKGEPAVSVDGPLDARSLLRLKGETGSRGPQGVIGPKGYRGELGVPGRPGKPGPPGPDGRSIGHGQSSSQQDAQSAFSALRTESSYPRYNQVVTFQNTSVNLAGDFNAATGYFTCREAGAYYFSFHSTARVSMCLRIVSEALDNKLGFCDYNRNSDQVLSGGVVLQLSAGQKVWLESFEEKQTKNEARDLREKLIVFNGFLLFPDPS